MKKILSILFILFLSLNSSGKVYKRIISTSPSLTEILFAIGAGEYVKGVTTYCLYPETAKKLPKIGSAFNLDYEKIFREKADLVLLSKLSNTDTETKLKKLNISLKTIAHENLDDILNSILTIGKLTGKETEAKNLHRKLTKEINKYSMASDGHKVMFVIGSTISSNKIKNLYLAGDKTFYHDILLKLGLDNVIKKSSAAYPLVSGERIYKYNPDIIIHVMPEGRHKDKIDQLKKAWLNYDMIEAVKKNRIYFFSGDYYMLPGPRIIKAMSSFREALDKGSNVKSK